MAVTVTKEPPTSSVRQCDVILTLAHLLQQRSLSYHEEKNLVLAASVTCATKVANQENRQKRPRPPEGAPSAAGGSGSAEEELEVHLVLTGSPRPTFAETNAWLLESVGPTADADKNVAAKDADPEAGRVQLLQEYVAECTHNSTTRNANMNDVMGAPTRTGGSVLSNFAERKYSDGDASAGGSGGTITDDNTTANDNGSTSNNKGPMVGHAVVNAVSKAQGIGLQSSRAQMLQGTIDRPLWDQRRWTDGECLFSELIDRCGLESFMSRAGKRTVEGADAAAGSVVRPSSSLESAGRRIPEMTTLSAHLITVLTPGSAVAMGGTTAPFAVTQDAIEEIARGILRCLTRKKSPPASTVYLVFPPGCDRRAKETVAAWLSAAWHRLERYNGDIGAPKLMTDAKLEFVDVSEVI